jgi:hypothetical protein
MQANPLLGQVGGGWALEISIFSGPKWHLSDGLMPFHKAQKSIYFQGLTPSHLGWVELPASKALRTGRYKS